MRSPTRNALWALACVLAALAGFVGSIYWPMGFAPSYGPLEPCSATTPGTCLAPVGEVVTI